MSKKLITLALTALPTASIAEVDLYGSLAGSLQNETISGNNASQTSVRDNFSFVGFRGRDGLGNGFKVIWQIESRLRLGSGGSLDTLGTRDAFLGLEGGRAGKIRMGMIRNFQLDSDRVNQWQFGVAATPKGSVSQRGQLVGANGLGVFTNTEIFVRNAIRYDSAEFAGLSGGVMFGFGQNARKDVADARASNIVGAGLNYIYGPVGLHVTYQKEFNPASTLSAPKGSAPLGNEGKSASKQNVELDYQQGNWFLGAAYAYSRGYDWQDSMAGDQGGGSDRYGAGGYRGGSRSSVAAEVRARQAALSIAYTVGSFVPKLTYAKGWDQSADGKKVSNSGYNQYIAGVDYLLSKRTRAGVSYGYLKFGKNTTLAQSYGHDEALTLKTVALTFRHSF